MSTAASTVKRDGRVDVPGGWVWYEEQGEGPQAVLLLHGGPGAPSDYLEPLMAPLAARGYRVVRYDQLGSRRSAKPDDVSLWNVPRFIDEVETVRQALGLGQVHLLGQSWGSWLALDYALAHPEGLASLTLASGAASTPQCVAGMNRWKHELEPEMLAAFIRCEAEADWQHPDYTAAMDELYRRHLCRLDPWPEPLLESMRHMADPVYQTMWGPAEFTCTGTLHDWDRTDRLGEIRVPTLITVGRWDEVSPDCSETMHAGIAGSRLALFEESSHSAHLEEPERYLEVLTTFLADVDAARAG